MVICTPFVRLDVPQVRKYKPWRRYWEKRAGDKEPTCFVLDLLCLVANTVEGFDGIHRVVPPLQSFPLPFWCDMIFCMG